ncbi:MAG: iron chelate uptake ABC transporter family permease subunit [Chloroflexi bacterium]|nr:iron chelate uptake ABC transporter family permease subunit [Chloroflexota bacterium]
MGFGALKAIGSYRKASVTARLAFGGGALAVLGLSAAIASLALGPLGIPVGHVAAIVLDRVGIDVADFTITEKLVVEQLRAPRILVGGLVGMALGVSGAALQGLFRNPMADPGIIGVSAGGATGAVLSIALGLNMLFFLALPLFSFAGAMGAAFLVYGIAAFGGRVSMPTLLLAGVAVSSFLGAVVSAVIVMVPADAALREILFWLAGGLDGRTWEHVRIAAGPILVGVAIITLLSRDLNLLMLGDEEARSLGVRVRLVRPLILATAALVTGTAVAFSGTITFVGLVVPHMLRLLFGPDHRVLIPLSAAGGALFVVVADTIARTALQPTELRVGIITALVGAPFFLFLLIRNKRQAEAF